MPRAGNGANAQNSTSVFASTPQLQSFLKGLFTLLVLTVLWVFILPGFLAWATKQFYDHQLVKRMNSTAATEYRKYLHRKEEIDIVESDLIQGLKTRADADKSPADIHSLTESLKDLSVLREGLHSPVYPIGFFSDEGSYVFFIHFLFLGILYLLSPTSWPPIKINIRTTVILGLGIYLLFNWPNWFRNFLLIRYFPTVPVPGRTVFAWVQWDINPAGFLLQEARIFSMFLFDAVLWQIWIAHAILINEVTKDWSEHPLRLEAYGSRALLFSGEINRWQYQSLLLIGAFLPWTWFFWRKVHEQSDLRYITTAITIHVIWAISWFALSLPVMRAWRQWSHFRYNALSSVFGKPEKDPDADRVLEILREAAPVNALNVFGAGATVVGSMLLPLIHLFFNVPG